MLWKILTGFLLFAAIMKAEINSNVPEESKTIGVVLVGAPVNGNKTMQALELILSFIDKIILSDGWKMAVRLLPSENDYYMLQDVTGSGLYRIATCMDNINIQAIVGPGSSTSAKLMHPYAVKKDVPHVLPFATDPALRQTKRFPLMVRLSPPDTYQTQAVLDILQFYGWECLSIITTDNDYGFGVEDALMTLAMNRRIKLEVVTRLKTERSYFVEEITQVLSQLRDLKAHPIAVATNQDSGTHLLQEAFQREFVVSKNWVWILLDGLIAPGVLKVEYTTSNGDLQKTNFDGLIGTRPAASGGNLLRDLMSFWDDRNIGRDFDFRNELGFGLEKYIDGMLSVAHGVEGYRSKHQVLTSNEFDGLQLRNAILRAKASGLTSPLLFDPDGKINSTNYDILLSKSGKWTAMGDWKSVTKLNMSSLLFLNFSKSLRASRMNTPRPRQANSEQSPDVPIVHVVTILEPPFVMPGNANTSYKGEILSNRVYTDSVPLGDRKPGMDVELRGYCVDMLQKISENAGLRYTLRLVEDSKYGGYDSDSGLWSGIVGDIQRGESHAAVAPITVTAERAAVVDFSTAFVDIGLKYIINASAVSSLTYQVKEEPLAFGFLLPFQNSLYFAIAICVLCLASFLNLLSRLSPYGARGHFYLGPRVDKFRRKASSHSILTASEWILKSNRKDEVQKLREEKENADTRMGINNVLYFVWASLFWQTPETVPRAPSARILTAVWYLSAVVFVASYTANMVAFVASNQMDIAAWDSVSDLVSQTKIDYGTVSDSSVEFIFKSSGVKVATSIYNYLQSDPDRFMVSSTDEGLERVRNGSYAFFWDSLVLDLEASNSDCKLRTVNVGFGGVAYAAAFTKNSPLKPVFSRNILRLKESGYMTVLWERYFGELNGCISRTTAHDANYRRLQFEELAGVFYFVALAMGTGFILLTIEWIWAGIQDVNSRDVSAPKSLRDAIRIRLNRLQQDISQNWFPRKKPKIPLALLEESIFSLRRNTKDFSETHADDINNSMEWVDDGTTRRVSSIRFKIPGEPQPPS